MLQSWLEPDLSERKKRLLPSALQSWLEPSASLRGVAPLLVRSSSQTLLTPLLAAKSVSRRPKATCEPSGESCGSLTRSIITRSWASKGWGVPAARAGPERQSRMAAVDQSFMGAPCLLWKSAPKNTAKTARHGFDTSPAVHIPADARYAPQVRTGLAHRAMLMASASPGADMRDHI